jgi:sec-independent protein translocase protein TatA
VYLFIFETIGTQELILIAVIALVFLGPRKMPDIARKIGKMMNEFRSATSEFKSTWEREVNFEEETRALRETDILEEPKNIARVDADRSPETRMSPPEIRAIDPADIELPLEATETAHSDEQSTNNEVLEQKQSWL